MVTLPDVRWYYRLMQKFSVNINTSKEDWLGVHFWCFQNGWKMENCITIYTVDFFNSAPILHFISRGWNSNRTLAMHPTLENVLSSSKNINLLSSIFWLFPYYISLRGISHSRKKYQHLFPETGLQDGYVCNKTQCVEKKSHINHKKSIHTCVMAVELFI